MCDRVKNIFEQMNILLSGDTMCSMSLSYNDIEYLYDYIEDLHEKNSKLKNELIKYIGRKKVERL